MSAPAASVIGPDLAILGQRITVVTQSALRIDGDVRGDVNGREVTIGETGRVTGTIAANVVHVRGSVAGAIRGAQVTLHPTARVDGDVMTAALSISEGAELDGRVRRPQNPADVEPALDVAAIAAALGGPGE